MTPEGWKVAQLGEVAAFVNGDRGKNYPARSGFVVNGIPFINAGHIKDGLVDFSGMNFITEETYNKLGSGKTKLNDILYCIRGSLGKAALANNAVPGAIASSLVIVRPLQASNTKYLFYVLTGPLGEALVRELDSGSAQPNISATNLQNYRFPLPPLPEQRKIAAILSSVDEAIEGTQAVIDQLQVVKKAMMAELLTRGIPGRHTKFKTTEIGEVPEEWEVCRIGDLADIAYGLTVNGQRRGSLRRLPYLTVANLQDEQFDLAEVKEIGALDGDEDRYGLRHGDVLLVEGNANVERLGRAAMWMDQLPLTLHQNHLIRVRVCNPALTPAWVHLVLGAPAVREQIKSNAKTSSGLNTINSSVVGGLTVPVPSREEQASICGVFEAIESRRTSEVEAATQLCELKSALMSVLLTGEVRVQPDVEAA